MHPENCLGDCGRPSGLHTFNLRTSDPSGEVECRVLGWFLGAGQSPLLEVPLRSVVLKSTTTVSRKNLQVGAL